MNIPELHFSAKDFKLEWYSGTGKGGQHRNKHQNCCRITHLETGISANGTSSRERSANQKEAFHTLCNRLIAYYSVPEERRNTSERIRTYHAVRNEVIDHASGLKQTYSEVVNNGNLSDMINARADAVKTE